MSAHTTVCVTFARGFGPQTLNPKPILKAIPKIFGHADNAVRAEVGLVLRSFFFFFFFFLWKEKNCSAVSLQGFKLVVELRRWLGAALDTFLTELKPVQVSKPSLRAPDNQNFF